MSRIQWIKQILFVCGFRGVLFSGFRDCWFLVNFSTIWVLWIEGWLVFGHLVNVGLWRIPWILFYRVFRGCWFSVDLENVGFRVDSVELCFFWWTRKVLEFRVYLRFRSCLRFCLIRNVWLNKLICQMRARLPAINRHSYLGGGCHKKPALISDRG